MDSISQLVNIIASTRPSWWDHAACSGAPTEIFFPNQGSKTSSHNARYYCSRCPPAAKQPCLNENLYESYGIFGGYSRDQRIDIRNGRTPREVHQ